MIAASGITTRSKLPSALAYEDEVNTFTQNQRIPDGAVGTPSLTHTSQTTTGLYFPTTNQVALTNNGTQRFRTTTAGAFVTGSLTVSGPLTLGTTGIGATLNMSVTTTPQVLEVTQAPCTINLTNQGAFGLTSGRFYIIQDTARLLAGGTPLTINPFSFSGLGFDTINEADGAQGVWNDLDTPATGPGGAGAVCATTGGTWLLTPAYLDPAVAGGGLGGWDLQLIAAGAY